jgi:hypothetical protein
LGDIHKIVAALREVLSELAVTGDDELADRCEELLSKEGLKASAIRDKYLKPFV